MSFDRKKEIIRDFITLYRSLPEVWNVKNYNYNNRKAKIIAYNKLLTVYKKCDPNSNRDTVVKKINSLRTNFRKELKKVKDSQRSATSTDDVYVPSLWYFNELLFLTDEKTANSIRSTIAQAQQAEPIENRVTDNVTSSEVIIETPIPKRIKKIDSSEELFKRAIQELNREEDEFLIMAKAYAVKLKKMSEQQRMYADRLIHEVLLEGQLNQLKRNSTVTHTESHNITHNSTSTHPESLSSSEFSYLWSYDRELDNIQSDSNLSLNVGDISTPLSSPSLTRTKEFLKSLPKI